MFAAFPVRVPPNTPASSPVVEIVALPAGVITWVGARFPRNTASLLHTRALRSSHQVWPVNPDETIAADGLLVGWRESYDMLQPPHELRLEAYNTDDRYPHTVTWFFEISESRPAGAPTAASTLLERLRSLVGGA